MPIHANATPIINNHPVIGSNNTSKIPNPIPTRHTPIVFFNKQNMLFLPSQIIIIYTYQNDIQSYCSKSFLLYFIPNFIIYVKLLTIIKKYYTIFIEHTSIKENKKMNMLKNIKYNNIFNLLIYTYFCQTRKE